MVCACSADARAQPCDARLDFNAAPLQLAWHAGTDPLTFGASVGGGADALFGAASVAVSARDPQVYAVAARFGTDQPLTLDNRWHACPLVRVGFARGPTRVQAGAGAGGAIGVLLVNRAGVAVVPAFGARLLPEALRSDGEQDGRSSGSYPEVEGATAVILRGRLLVRPSFSWGGGRRRGISVQLTVSYGWERRTSGLSIDQAVSGRYE